MRKFLKTTLVVSMMFAYGISPGFAVEIEHQHASDGDHHHCLIDWLFDCHDHPCDGHHHHDSPDHSHEGGDGSHSHVLFTGFAVHATNWASGPFPVPPGALLIPLTELGQTCPDGPTYGVLKPPQL